MSLTVTSAPWQQVAMPALDLRRWVGALIAAEGVSSPTDMVVAQHSTPNMSVDISAGSALVRGDTVTGQGYYLAYNDALFNLTGFTAANATNPRIDRVTIRVRDAFHGDAANDISFQILTGTATSGATLANLSGAASVPGSQLLLANILVPANATTITTANTANVAAVASTAAGGRVTLYDSGYLGGTQATLDSGSAGFSTLFNHLQIIAQLRCDQASGANCNALLRFNGDTGTNYDWAQNNGASNGTGVAFIQTTVTNSLAGTSTPAGGFTVEKFDIPFYNNTTTQKMVTGLVERPYHYDGVNPSAPDYFGGGWHPATTAAVNRVVLSLPAGSYVAGSRMIVYGYN